MLHHEYANEADDDDVPKPAQSLGTPVSRQKFNRQIKPRGVASHPFQLYNNTYSQLIILDITWYAHLDVHNIMIAILIGVGVSNEPRSSSGLTTAVSNNHLSRSFAMQI